MDLTARHAVIDAEPTVDTEPTVGTEPSQAVTNTASSPLLTLIVLIVATLILGGCSQVKPWQRENLAKPEMQFGDSRLSQKLRTHTYFSKEAAHGGISGNSGGCGCN